MAKRKLLPRRHVMAAVTDLRKVTNGLRVFWGQSTSGRLPDGSWGKRPDKDLPGALVADWVDIRSFAQLLREAADELDTLAAGEIMRIRRGERDV